MLNMNSHEANRTYSCEALKPSWVGASLLAGFNILAQYSLPIMSYGLVLASLYGGACLLVKGKLVINKSMLYFVLWCIVSQLAIYLHTGTFEKNRNTYFFMFVALFLLATLGTIERESFIKVYYVIGMICCILVDCQFILSNLYGIPQSSIRILPVAAEDMHYWIQNSNRVSGLFTEPQAFCSYIIPLLIILLFRRSFINAVFVSLSIIASTSSQGIILALFVWGYYLIVCQANIAKRIMRGFGLLLLLLLALYLMRSISILRPIVDKIISINPFGYDIRLTKGFQIYFAMPLWDKIVGIGFGNLRDHLLNGNYKFFWLTLTRDELLAYITTMSNVLVSFGVIAFLLFLNIYYRNWHTGTQEAKVMLIVILLSSFTQTALFNAWFIYFWVTFGILDSYDRSRYFGIMFRCTRND